MTVLDTPELREAAKTCLADLERDFRESAEEWEDAKTAGDETARWYSGERMRLIYCEVSEVEAALAAPEAA